jgi:imidazolonepropionase-like amidohydrolase
MKRLAKLILITCLPIFINSCGTSVTHDLVITHVNIVDVETGEILPNRTVGIDSNRISKIYREEVRASWSSEKFDGQNGYLIPGLWDMHTHFFWNEKEASRLQLAHGVTGIREMWGVMDSTNAFRERNRNGHYGPDIYSAGTIIDGHPKVWDKSVEVTNAAEARAEVERQIAEGVDFIKVYSKLNKEAFDAIAVTAKENGIPFAGHIPTEISIYHAAQKGMASAEHFYGLLPGASSMGDRLEKPKFTEEYQFIDSFSESRFDSLCQVLVKNDMWLCPTLTVNKVFTILDKPEGMRQSSRMDYVNQGLKSMWFAYISDSANAAQELKTFNFLLPLVGKAHANGVKILAGTDYPNPYTYPGFSMHDELALLVEGGMSELAALQAATSAATTFMGKTADFGTVEEGKVASMVLLKKNPLDDITHSTEIEAVIQRGQLFDKEALQGMLNEVKEEISNTATPYSEVFQGLVSEIGFEASLDSLTLLIAANDPTYLLSESDLGFVMEDYYNNGETEKMVEFAEYMTRWFPNSSPVFTWSGEVFLMAERQNEAITFFKKALELDPTNSRAEKNLKELIK